MKPLVIRFVLTLVLFAGWLGYLGYLVWSRPLTESNYPLVVSRPQLMTSDIDVVAQIDDPKEKVEVKAILWPRRGPPIKVGDKLDIREIEKCQPLPRYRDE